MSKACRSDSGTKARRSTLPGPTLGAEGGSCRQFCGRYDRYRFTPISASDSLLTSMCPTPLSTQCTWAPPISSSVVFSPVTICTMRSLARYMLALPSTMITMSQKAGM